MVDAFDADEVLVVGVHAVLLGALAVHIAENDYLNGETIRLDGALRMAPR